METVTNSVKKSGRNGYRSELIVFDHLRPFIVRFVFNYNSECTKKAYTSDLLDFFKWFGKRADSSPSMIHPKEVLEIHGIAWKSLLLQKYSQRSVNRKLAVLSAFFSFLEMEKIIDSNPMRRVRRLPNPKEYSTRDLSDQEILNGIAKVIETKNIVHIMIIYLFIYTGLRCSEVLSLTFGDIISIDGENFFKITTKGAKERIVFINHSLNEKIIDFNKYILACSRAELNFDIHSVFLVQNKNHFVFYREGYLEHKFLTKRSSIKTVYSVLEKYFGSGVRPHMLRSTVIGHLIDKGSPIHTIASFVGHTDIKTTNSYYQRRISLKKNAGREIDWGHH